jgi:hypothetical protein
VSRLGLGLLSPYHDDARSIVSLFREFSAGAGGLRPYLGDDLRLVRWSYLPLVAGILAPSFQCSRRHLAASYPPSWTWYRTAGVCAYHGRDRHLYFSPAGGGTVRVYRGAQLIYEDRGFILETGRERLGTGGYDPERPVRRTQAGFAVSCRLAATRFFFPGLLSRLILRLGCSTALGAQVLRSLIDYVRLKRRTASNQSAAPIATRKAAYLLERSIEITGSNIRIVDRVSGPADARPASVTPLVVFQDGTPCTPIPMRDECVTLTKNLDMADGSDPAFSWHADPVTKNAVREAA